MNGDDYGRCLFIRGRLKGLRPFTNYTSPSPFKERGIQGVRFSLNKRKIKVIIEYKEKVSSNFEGTIIDIETIGDFNETYKNTDDSREYENLRQVIFGFINREGLCVFCAEGEEAIIGLNSLTEQILDKLERPFYAFNTVFESGVWFHQLNKKIIFDGELKGSQRESKLNAVRSLGIPNYDDPFNDIGKLCKEAWERREFDKAIAHNRACLLKERDILLKRRFRTPAELRFVK